MPSIGASDGQRELVGIKEFLIRYSPQLSLLIISCKQFPPFHVLNEELMTGGSDLGMSGGCFWKPFAITKEDYEVLREEMMTDPSLEFEYDVELEEKENLKKWCGAIISKHNPRKKENK